MNIIKRDSKGLIAIKRITSMRETILVMVILALFIVMSFTSEYFLLPQTMLNLLMSLTVEGIIAIGMVILLVSGGIDLSAGANMAFTGVVTGLLYVVVGLPMALAITLGLLVGLGIGLINGFLIAKVGLNPLITTLGTAMAFSGLMMMLTKGKAVLLPPAFQVIGRGNFLGIQYPVYILIALVIIFEIFLRKSRALRTSYYVGGNENAAKLNGINVNRVKIVNYALTGLLSGLTGIILASRLTTASVTVGGETSLRVITACIIGGASLLGGEGTVLGAFLGVVFIQLLSTSLNIMNVDVHVKTFVTGLILIAAITIDILNEKRKSAKITASMQKCIEEN
jgi:ribose transport system permease protein